MHATPPAPRRKPLAHNNEEVPDSAPPTDFSQLDMLASAPVPTTSVDICHADGFSLNSGVEISGGDGALLVGGEAFVWRPWLAGGNSNKKGKGGLVNDKGMWEVGEEGFALLGAVWPRPGMFLCFVSSLSLSLSLSVPLASCLWLAVGRTALLEGRD
jgi:hypothetical protein